MTDVQMRATLVGCTEDRGIWAVRLERRGQVAVRTINTPRLGRVDGIPTEPEDRPRPPTLEQALFVLRALDPCAYRRLEAA